MANPVPLTAAIATTPRRAPCNASPIVASGFLVQLKEIIAGSGSGKLQIRPQTAGQPPGPQPATPAVALQTATPQTAPTEVPRNAPSPRRSDTAKPGNALRRAVLPVPIPVLSGPILPPPARPASLRPLAPADAAPIATTPTRKTDAGDTKGEAPSAPAPAHAKPAELAANPLVSRPALQPWPHLAPSPAAPPSGTPPVQPPKITALLPLSAATAPLSTTPHAPAAAQIGHACASLHLAQDGGPITIRLEPAELGTVQIRIERPHTGGATVTVSVERPETLHLLQADLTHLHQALDRAGMPAEQRSVSLHLTPPAPATGSSAQTDQGPRGNNHPPRAPDPQNAAGANSEPEDFNAPPNASGWLRAGINITA